jgi:hypothetical protein
MWWVGSSLVAAFFVMAVVSENAEQERRVLCARHGYSQYVASGSGVTYCSKGYGATTVAIPEGDR